MIYSMPKAFGAAALAAFLVLMCPAPCNSQERKAGGILALVKLHDENARCLDGSPAGFYIRESKDPTAGSATLPPSSHYRASLSCKLLQIELSSESNAG